MFACPAPSFRTPRALPPSPGPAHRCRGHRQSRWGAPATPPLRPQTSEGSLLMPGEGRGSRGSGGFVRLCPVPRTSTAENLEFPGWIRLEFHPRPPAPRGRPPLTGALCVSRGACESCHLACGTEQPVGDGRLAPRPGPPLTLLCHPAVGDSRRRPRLLPSSSPVPAVRGESVSGESSRPADS